MKPVIGIGTDVTGVSPKKACAHANYYEAIEKAGGIPVLIPPMANENLSVLLSRLNGIVFIGGDDYCPEIYGQETHKTTQLVHPDRQAFDMLLVKTVIKDNKLPILAICAGSQLLNIALGGTLIQDIPTYLPDSKVKHSSPKGWEIGFNSHVAELTAGSKLAQIYAKEKISVITSHHQALDRLGKGLSKAAQAEDGIIEALELAEHPFAIGVQWHPERDYDNNKQLFEKFIQHASNTK